MAFTHALYYPWIDIENPGWLKTATLYWDRISTIVPEHIQVPYENAETRYLMRWGILDPIYISPNDPAVNDASKSFISYLPTNEAQLMFNPDEINQAQIRDLILQEKLARLGFKKMNKLAAQALLESGKVAFKDDYWFYLDKETANYYMVLLATNIAEQRHLYPVTDNETNDALLNRVKLGVKPTIRHQNVAEGLLVKIVVDSIGIAENTQLDDILQFREDYQDELGQFRTEIGKLALGIAPDTPTIEALEQQAHDIYKNQISPAISRLRRALNRAKIRSIVTHATSVLVAGTINNILMPQGTVENYGVHVGMQLLATTVNYALDRSQQLDENPYSLVLAIEKQLA